MFKNSKYVLEYVSNRYALFRKFYEEVTSLFHVLFNSNVLITMRGRGCHSFQVQRLWSL